LVNFITNQDKRALTGMDWPSRQASLQTCASGLRGGLLSDQQSDRTTLTVDQGTLALIQQPIQGR
jgi:hypothetical protein